MLNSKTAPGLIGLFLLSLVLAGVLGVPAIEQVMTQTAADGVKHLTPLGIVDLVLGATMVLLTTIVVASNKD